MLSLRHRRLQSQRIVGRRLRLALRGGRVLESQILFRHLENVVLQRAIRGLLRNEFFARIVEFGNGLCIVRETERDRKK